MSPLSKYIQNPKNLMILETYVQQYAYRSQSRTIYDVIGWILADIQDHGNITHSDMQRYIQTLTSQQTIAFQSPVFHSVRDAQAEEDHFLEHPFNVEDGVLECFKCHSMRTISFQRQTRSADEGATTFAQCIDCGHRWRHCN